MVKNFSITRSAALTLHYLQSMKRNPARFIEIIVWPSFELLLFGMLALSMHKVENAALSAALGILAGVMYWNFTARIIQESVAQFLDDAFSKNIQNLFIAPFSLLELSIGLIVSSVLKLALSFIFLLGVVYIFLPNFFSSIMMINPTLLLELIIFGSILSTISLAFVFLLGARVSFIGWFISTLLQVFSCVFFERQILPGILYSISYIVPSSYIFEAIRAMTVHAPVAAYTHSVVWALLALYFIASIVFLRFSYSYARSQGVLTKI